ncbi:MAG: alpha/beta hydrolase [Pseudomonadota bacterium]|nr:alpha/beta hydrolase [Pseudomonadota bacterium]
MKRCLKTRSLFAAAALMWSATAHAAPVVTARNCHLPGVEEALRCYSVPVTLDAPGGPMLKLHVTVAPAFREAARRDPLFVLAGGPGEAGSDVLPLLSTAFRRVRATRDIVLIDQRGTGFSGRLDCPTRPEQETMIEAQLDQEMFDCIAVAKKQHRLSAYTTANAARDIEQVRQQLGYGKINVWGGSYGTRLGQVYARAYPDSVRTLVLDGVAAPEQVIPAGGRDSQTALDNLFKTCAKDPACNKAYPNLRAEFDAVSARVDKGDVVIDMADPRTAQPVKISMSSARYLGTIHSVLYSAADSRRLPFLLHSAYLGRWEPFVARRNLANDVSADGSNAVLLHLAVVCAEDMPRLTPALLASDAGVLTRTMIERMPAMCKAIDVPPAAWRAPTMINAPALLFSGALDPVTPPHRAVAAAKFMANARHIVVANAGHGVSQLGCTPRLLRTFLDNPEKTLDATCLDEIPAPYFQLGSAGPQP